MVRDTSHLVDPREFRPALPGEEFDERVTELLGGGRVAEHRGGVANSGHEYWYGKEPGTFVVRPGDQPNWIWDGGPERGGGAAWFGEKLRTYIKRPNDQPNEIWDGGPKQGGSAIWYSEDGRLVREVPQQRLVPGTGGTGSTGNWDT